MTKYLVLAALVLMPLTACAQQQIPSTAQAMPGQMPTVKPPEDQIDKMPTMAPPENACNPPTDLVGKPRSVLQTMKFGTTVRILEPGDAMTMDYSPTRLNIILNDKGTIVQVKCG